MRLYLYRAKVKVNGNEIPSKIAWRYGSLNRVECMGNPLGDFREQYEKDHYQIALEQATANYERALLDFTYRSLLARGA